MYIKLKTQIPHKEDIKLIKELSKYEPKCRFNHLPLVWKEAKDFLVYDRWGNVFIDFTSGICVTNAGHSNEEVKTIIEKQLLLNQIYTYTFPTEIRRDYLKELIKFTPSFCEKAFLLSAGTEACEHAFKLMKLYGKRKNKDIIISFYGAMHGRTLGSELLRGKAKWAGTLIPPIVHLPFPSKKDNFNDIINLYIRNGLNPYKICGIFLETYQGYSAIFYPKKYIQDLVKFARKYEALICFDEVQGGFGRTGKMFNFEHYEVEPDLICVGKGMSSSLPLSGILGRKKLLDIFTDASTTFSTNPICCAAGLANLQEIKRILPSVKRKGNFLFNYLRKYLKGYEINGKGLLAGIITPTVDFATKVCHKTVPKGLLVILTGANSVKIAPPLTIPLDALKEGLEILVKTIKEVE